MNVRAPQSLRAPLLHVAAICLLGLAPACDAVQSQLDELHKQLPTTAPRVHLGDAAYPEDATTEGRVHQWRVSRLRPHRYGLSYRLATKAAQRIWADYEAFAISVGFKAGVGGRFRWRPSARCRSGLHCIYEQALAQDEAALGPLASLFRSRALDMKLSALDATALVVAFVQQITYRIPKDEPFGLLPPALVVQKGWGDCDSKALVAHMLLRELDIDSVLVSSRAHRHTMLAVALPAPGKSFTWRGRRYAFVEVTAKRAPIGYINPKLLRPNDWRVERMNYGGQSIEGAPAPPPKVRRKARTTHPKRRVRRRVRTKVSAKARAKARALRRAKVWARERARARRRARRGARKRARRHRRMRPSRPPRPGR
ncbi:MAG: hypothetical protein KC502_18390 [Myxococcales bacterium]|nr:hypothetical protein [Myxococcales bacterium]